jgi:hypothetical protein
MPAALHLPERAMPLETGVSVMPAGRPSKYKPQMCKTVIEAGSQGMTLAEMADCIGVTRETIRMWMSEKPEFSCAVKEGLDKAQAWWERKGREATFGGVDGYNATSYIFQMKNRFKEDWADTKLLGSDPDNPLPTSIDVTFRGTQEG